ncbi:TIGR02281 family clan AA aspartic protease [Rhizobium sp. CG5]|uniref:TIGR02281 family clan AA aspartic protease n=1 Tax=Rhizobium sp. CG5 TaxID=2726076 RepID=UPI002033AC5F|nr:TIGR02281 family clan AA aspartic protease [Rhizobium sp. CG5]MCM2473653.1 TIGR02281 family clan AA aspartic protease [Rhizobium sp. CG5]
MLMRSLVILAVVSVVALQVPSVFDMMESGRGGSDGTGGAAGGSSDQTVLVSTPSGGSVVLDADRQGHYRGDFRINGKAVEGMIDTGASLVALNETTARRLGYGATALDFKYAVNTANGKTEAAHVTLRRVEIGGIRVDEVDAMVLRDKALSTTLIGMSFLKQIGSYSVENDALRLNR